MEYFILGAIMCGMGVIAWIMMLCFTKAGTYRYKTKLRYRFLVAALNFLPFVILIAYMLLTFVAFNDAMTAIAS